MYGYIVPIKSELGQAYFCLYRAFYCGICKSTGKTYGQCPRFTTNYDMVFLSLLLHDTTEQEVTFCNEGCVCNPFKKKTVVCRNDLFDRIVAANIILSYRKADDDVIDGGGIGKRMVRRMLSKHYRKAKAMLPEVDDIVTKKYGELRELEKQNYSGVDRVADCFASMMLGIGKKIAPTISEDVQKLLYCVGKFVYLCDALDDVSEDYKKKRYNPLLCYFGNFKDRKQFIEDNRDELTFMLYSTVNRATEYFNKTTLSGAQDLMQNIVYKGMRNKCEELLSSEKKLALPKI